MPNLSPELSQRLHDAITHDNVGRIVPPTPEEVALTPAQRRRVHAQDLREMLPTLQSDAAILGEIATSEHVEPTVYLERHQWTSPLLRRRRRKVTPVMQGWLLAAGTTNSLPYEIQNTVTDPDTQETGTVTQYVTDVVMRGIILGSRQRLYVADFIVPQSDTPDLAIVHEHSALQPNNPRPLTEGLADRAVLAVTPSQILDGLVQLARTPQILETLQKQSSS